VKIVGFGADSVGVSDGTQVWNVSRLLDSAPSWPPGSALRFAASFDRLKAELMTVMCEMPTATLADTQLAAPVRWPSKLIAFPANYASHNVEMHTGNRADINGFFLKAPSSICGPNDDIVLPDLPEASIHHECELAIVIGAGGRAIPRERVREHILGYACLIDVTVRGKQERVMRKSFDTFCPLGPWITTADEIDDPDRLDLSLSVNGEVRQQANTRDLIVGISEMVEMASSVMTLNSGDVIATGTPGGVGPLVVGDQVEISIERVGQMSLAVRAGGTIDNRAFDATTSKAENK
jgi:2-keto-4-pentenoate hydratase/2-oxohepta-3-ene-1,7-dioic acid hydratase in catechol pathway